MPGLQGAEDGEQGTEADAGPQTKAMSFKKQGDQAAKKGAEWQDKEAL